MFGLSLKYQSINQSTDRSINQSTKHPLKNMYVCMYVYVCMRVCVYILTVARAVAVDQERVFQFSCGWGGGFTFFYIPSCCVWVCVLLKFQQQQQQQQRKKIKINKEHKCVHNYSIYKSNLLKIFKFWFLQYFKNIFY